MKISHLFISVQVICLLPFFTYAQLPVVQSYGGEGKYVNWPKIKADVEMREKAEGGGPGFFYNDCDQGLTPLRASSTLANQGRVNYNVKNLSDDNPMTAWVEGKDDYGIGESFEIQGPGVNAIYNGYQSSPINWLQNSRVKKFKVYKNNVPLCILNLTDEMGRQGFDLPGNNKYNPEKLYTYKFEIMEVYKGTKWPDVAISEINFGLCCVSGSTNIQTSLSPVNISELKEGITIQSIDVETGKISNTEVLKILTQKHVSMLKISCETKELELTGNHPLYIKDFGFSSIDRYMNLKNIDNYENLVNRIEFALWDESKGGLYYEKLKQIKLINGVFNTYTIGKLSSGNTFISNGFITKTY